MNEIVSVMPTDDLYYLLSFAVLDKFLVTGMLQVMSGLERQIAEYAAREAEVSMRGHTDGWLGVFAQRVGGCCRDRGYTGGMISTSGNSD
jgi:hypothetical protein